MNFRFVSDAFSGPVDKRVVDKKRQATKDKSGRCQDFVSHRSVACPQRDERGSDECENGWPRDVCVEAFAGPVGLSKAHTAINHRIKE